MPRDLISRYVWLVDLLNRYGKLTRAQINEMWERSELSDGRPMPERTFHYYRRAIEQNFNIDIRCNSLGEYYIDTPDNKRDKAFASWLLDTYAVGSALREVSQGDADERIRVEEIPSAGHFLTTAIQAIRRNEKVRFTYAGFKRSRAETGILFHPYFLKLYKQRWYMVGLREQSGEIRTYALDRIKEMQLLKETFTMPEGDNPAADIFDNIIGITSSKAEVRLVRFKADRTQAKYFRALPLHHSQTEELHDDYSIFTLKVKLNYELLHELLSCGRAVTVLEPPELRAMIVDELKQTLSLY